MSKLYSKHHTASGCLGKVCKWKTANFGKDREYKAVDFFYYNPQAIMQYVRLSWSLRWDLFTILEAVKMLSFILSPLHLVSHLSYSVGKGKMEEHTPSHSWYWGIWNNTFASQNLAFVQNFNSFVNVKELNKSIKTSLNYFNWNCFRFDKANVWKMSIFVKISTEFDAFIFRKGMSVHSSQ